ncbi:MAG: hypothetical protein IKF14_09855 [Atopobiaceae bacterium]|nr:hypothetical protein [Atopobiaceae bacterium]
MNGRFNFARKMLGTALACGLAMGVVTAPALAEIGGEVESFGLEAVIDTPRPDDGEGVTQAASDSDALEVECEDYATEDAGVLVDLDEQVASTRDEETAVEGDVSEGLTKDTLLTLSGDVAQGAAFGSEEAPVEVVGNAESDSADVISVEQSGVEASAAKGSAVAGEVGLTAQATGGPNVYYRVHRQTYGWEKGWKKNGKTSGTTGQSKRLEGIYIKIGNLPVSGSIRYCTHVQTYGWQGWKTAGKLSGTTGKSKRLEAIRIKLTGKMAKKYDVWYRVHAQHFGWMGWAKNGGKAGTEGYSYRLEAIQIRLLRKGRTNGVGSTANAFRRYRPPAIAQSYVGSYVKNYLAPRDIRSYAGVIHTGSVYDTRSVYVSSVSGNRVTFKVDHGNAYTAAGDNTTGWITSTVKGNRTDFTYTGSENYGSESGTGYLVFSGGMVTLKLTTTYRPPVARGQASLGMATEQTFSKGTHDVWG